MLSPKKVARPFDYHKDKQWLEEQYWVFKKSTHTIGEELNIPPGTIWDWMSKLDIPRRSLSNAGHLRQVNHVILSPYLREVIDGELLGDGSIELGKGGQSGRYRHGTKHRLYLEWLFKFLDFEELQQSSEIRKRIIEEKGAWCKRACYFAKTRNYEELASVYQRWYPKGKKSVPLDLILTPVSVLHWYIGDGCYIYKKKPNYTYTRIDLATCSFSRAGVNLLRNLLASALRTPLRNIHVRSYLTCPNLISFGKKDVLRHFFDFIGPCPKAIKAIYGYKWPGGEER